MRYICVRRSDDLDSEPSMSDEELSDCTDPHEHKGVQLVPVWHFINFWVWLRRLTVCNPPDQIFLIISLLKFGPCSSGWLLWLPVSSMHAILLDRKEGKLDPNLAFGEPSKHLPSQSCKPTQASAPSITCLPFYIRVMPNMLKRNSIYIRQFLVPRCFNLPSHAYCSPFIIESVCQISDPPTRHGHTEACASD